MSGDTPEYEIVERLVDSTREAADTVAQMCATAKSELVIMPRSLLKLRTALSKAAGASYQLGHARRNPAFFDLRDALDKLISYSAAAVTGGPRANIALAQIGRTLDLLVDVAKRLTDAAAITHLDAVAMMSKRAAAIH